MDWAQKLRIYLLQRQRQLRLSDAQLVRRSGGLLAADRYQALVDGSGALPPVLAELVGLARALDAPLAEVLDVSGWSRRPG